MLFRLFVVPLLVGDLFQMFKLVNSESRDEIRGQLKNRHFPTPGSLFTSLENKYFGGGNRR